MNKHPPPPINALATAVVFIVLQSVTNGLMGHFVLLDTLPVSYEYKLRLTVTRSGCSLILLVLSVDSDELELLGFTASMSTNIATGISRTILKSLSMTSKHSPLSKFSKGFLPYRPGIEKQELVSRLLIKWVCRPW